MKHTHARLLAARAGLLAAVLACTTAAARPQAAPPPETSPSLSGIAHVALRVANLDASRAFYKQMGFEEAFAFDQGGSPTEAFIKINDTQFIELYPQRRPEEPIGFLHVCYLSRDLGAINEFYRLRHLAPTAVARGGAGNLLFSLHGPGLENIEFMKYMPGSRHTNDIGKHLGAHRIGDRVVAVAFPADDLEGAVSFYARGMVFPRKSEQTSAFRIPGDSGEQIEILPGPDHHLRLSLETADLKQAARELKKLGIPITQANAALVIHDPDGNAIALKAAPNPRSGEKPSRASTAE
jgi:catechol 2,3-dioxygenase-like lactoylglutathione lyase family enzyme